MDYSFLESIYTDYSSNFMDGMDTGPTEAEKAFQEKYIQPVIDADYDKGMAMDAMFGTAIAASNELDFQNGFKACMRLIAECLAKED